MSTHLGTCANTHTRTHTHTHAHIHTCRHAQRACAHPRTHMQACTMCTHTHISRLIHLYYRIMHISEVFMYYFICKGQRKCQTKTSNCTQTFSMNSQKKVTGYFTCPKRNHHHSRPSPQQSQYPHKKNGNFFNQNNMSCIKKSCCSSHV